jgi:DNA-binding NtrC family response regulator
LHLDQDHLNARPQLESLLGDQVQFVDSASQAELVVIGSRAGGCERTIRALAELRRDTGSTPVIVIAWESTERLAVASIKHRVADYFPAPADLQEVASSILRCARGAVPVAELNESGRPIVGGSPAMEKLRAYLLLVARRDCNALVVGETGTGKDLIAEAIHRNSPRRSKPFVCLNCAAIPDTLLESELFGFERGAFTGANVSTEGKIQQANGGTILFDEIGEMTPYAQAKILRVIESKQVQRLGAKMSLPVDVRIIAATNQNLEELVEQKQRFRKDLYFRLNVARIHTPPLRERRSDIEPLLAHYVGVFNRQTGSAVAGFTREAIKQLEEYDWPGNVRELKNVVESIFIDPPRDWIDVEHLPLAGREGRSDERELQQLLDALEATHWNKSKAAEKLHWSRMRIYRKMAKYQIQDQAAEQAAG